VAKIRHCCILLFAFWGIYTIYATSISTRMVALQDSLKIGEIGKIALVVDYSDSKNLMFPDTSYQHENIELRSKTYFQTSRIDSITLRDSAVYSFQSFKTISPIRISLPVYVLTTYDTIEIKIDSINIKLKPLLNPEKSTFQFHSFNSFLKPNLPLHPAIWGSIILGIIILIGIVVKILYKPIRQKFLIYSLRKSFQRLESMFTNVRNRELNEKNAIDLLIKWQSFLGKLDGKSYSSKTLNEFKQLTDNKYIKEEISKIEKTIYSTQKAEEINLSSLLEFAKEKLDLKITEIKTHEK